jgi:hypothetical protein
MKRRIDFDVDSNTANEMEEFFAARGISKQALGSNVPFCGSFSIGPSGFSFSWDPEKDPRTIPNLVKAIFDAIEIFTNRIKGIKVDGKMYSIDNAKIILAQSSTKEDSPFKQFEDRQQK